MTEAVAKSVPVFDEALEDRLALVAASFERLLGRSLIDSPTPERLWRAPCVIVAHGRQADPIFFYGNQRALDAFAMDFGDFCQLPSRNSAEPLARDERARLLERVSRDGYIDDYSGVRISATGRRFRIEQAVVWNLIDEHGVCHGQAATFDRWVML